MKTKYLMPELFGKATFANDLPNGVEFEPELHFTGGFPEKQSEVKFFRAMEEVIRKHNQNLVAFYAYSPLPNAFSIQLQFKDNASAEACRADYLALPENPLY